MPGGFIIDRSCFPYLFEFIVLFERQTNKGQRPLV